MENSKQSAFPSGLNTGLTKLEYALIHSTWEPKTEDIEREIRYDRQRNPHNDSYKPKLRSWNEISNELRVKHFTELLNSI